MPANLHSASPAASPASERKPLKMPKGLLRGFDSSVNLRGECPASLGSHKYVPFHLGAPLAAEREKKPLSRAVFVLPWVESTETSEGP